VTTRERLFSEDYSRTMQNLSKVSSVSSGRGRRNAELPSSRPLPIAAAAARDPYRNRTPARVLSSEPGISPRPFSAVLRRDQGPRPRSGPRHGLACPSPLGSGRRAWSASGAGPSETEPLVTRAKSPGLRSSSGCLCTTESVIELGRIAAGGQRPRTRQPGARSAARDAAPGFWLKLKGHEHAVVQAS
jgi:hypothetical protein